MAQLARGGALAAAFLAACADGDWHVGPSSVGAPPVTLVAPATAPSAGPAAGAGDGTAIVLGAPTTSKAVTRMRVLVAGDLIPHRPSLVAPSSIRAALEPLAATFAHADAVIANYEAATGEVDAKAFRMAYAAEPAWMAELTRTGITALTVANNHACDLGASGVEATLGAAERAGAIAIGGDRGDPWTPRVIAEAGGKHVCAVGWTTLMNAESKCARGARLAIADLDRAGRARIGAAITRARETCDATIAILHGGREYAAQTREVMDQARYAADVGADAVIIHHPHIVSPVVVHTTKDGRRVPVFASIGNLVSNQGESWRPSMFPVLRENRRLVCVNGWTRLGLLADLDFELDDHAPRLSWGFHLTWTENEHATDRTVPVPRIEARLLDPTSDEAVVSRLMEDERGPVAVFRDPCWTERLGGGADRTTPREGRCVTSLRRPAAAALPVVVAKRAKRRK